MEQLQIVKVIDGRRQNGSCLSICPNELETIKGKSPAELQRLFKLIVSQVWDNEVTAAEEISRELRSKENIVDAVQLTGWEGYDTRTEVMLDKNNIRKIESLPDRDRLAVYDEVFKYLCYENNRVDRSAAVCLEGFLRRKLA